MKMENRATAAFPNEKWLLYYTKDSNNCSFLSFPVSQITDRISFGVWFDHRSQYSMYSPTNKNKTAAIDTI